LECNYTQELLQAGCGNMRLHDQTNTSHSSIQSHCTTLEEFPPHQKTLGVEL